MSNELVEGWARSIREARGEQSARRDSWPAERSDSLVWGWRPAVARSELKHYTAPNTVAYQCTVCRAPVFPRGATNLQTIRCQVVVAPVEP
jgi:hypothetical protein